MQDSSTHAPYTEGDDAASALPRDQTVISTHAPYTEGDGTKITTYSREIISTHAPYTEGDFQSDSQTGQD